MAAFPTGAFVAGLAAAMLVRRFGSAKVAVAGTILTGLGAVAAGLAPSTAAFMAGLFFAGAMDAVSDVAQHVHGMRVQRRYGRSIVNSFHAVWSVGAILGGSMAAGAIALGLSVGVHLALSAAVFSTVAVVALRFCLHGREEAAEGKAAPGAVPPRTPLRFGVRPRTVLMVAGSGHGTRGPPIRSPPGRQPVSGSRTARTVPCRRRPAAPPTLHAAPQSTAPSRTGP